MGVSGTVGGGDEGEQHRTSRQMLTDGRGPHRIYRQAGRKLLHVSTNAQTSSSGQKARKEEGPNTSQNNAFTRGKRSA